MSETIYSEDLMVENQKLRDALAGLVPWAGSLPEGPDWATPEAKARNRAMFEKALDDACKCFPDDYDVGNWVALEMEE